MLKQDALQSDHLEPPRGPKGLRDEVVLKLASLALKRVGRGRLRLTLPSGRAGVIGTGHDLEASLDVRSYKLLSRAMRRGSLGFAESYLAGDVETDELANVFRFFLANYEALAEASRGVFRRRLPERIAHRLRRNTKAGSRRNIAAHYDLGNAFYEGWLDPGMTYSSALFDHKGMSLEAGQDAKYDAVLQALDIVQTRARVLEVGCGWGGMAERVLAAGHDIDAITVSEEQFRHAKTRLAKHAGPNRVDVRFQDYRDVVGSYDHIVSIEMIEAVGEEHWPQYFSMVDKRLVPGGTAAIQAITINADDYDVYRRKPDFIQRYIFPGGMLPTTGIMQREAEAQGLGFEIVRTFGPDYAETLRRWRVAFLHAWPQLESLGFDARFKRMWLYYLTYCEVGFDTGVIDVGIYRFTKPQR